MPLICTKCSTSFTPKPNVVRGILLAIIGIPIVVISPGFVIFDHNALGFLIAAMLGGGLCWWAYQCICPKKTSCPACGSLSVIPLSTPAGQKLAAEAKKTA